MVRSRWSVFVLISLLPAFSGLLGPGPGWAASSNPAAGCPGDVAVLGGDLDPRQRAEVLAHLNVSPRTLLLRESMSDARSQAGGLIPPELLGVVAVSSGRLLLLPPARGLTVRTDATITLATAGMYVDALLIAGVRHADVWVSAPTAAPALGTTALLGLLQAARAACIAIPPARARLAMRALVLTSHVAQAYGAAAASTLLHTARRGAGEEGLPASTAVDLAAAAARTPLRPATRAALAAFLVDLGAAARHYADLRRPPAVDVMSNHRASSRVPVPLAPPGVQRGTVLRVANGTLTITAGAGARTLTHVPGHLVVTRNGRRAPLESIRPGDTVTLQTDRQGHMIRLAAIGAPTGGVPAPVVRSGIVLSAGSSGLTYRVSGGAAEQRLQGWPGLSVTRDGHRAALSDVRPNDRVRVVLGPDGRPSSVQAWAPPAVPPAHRTAAAPAPAHSVSVLRQPWPLALLVILVVLGLLLLGLRALPGMERTLPFVLVERRPAMRADAAAPATCELARGARVVCADGDVGPLAHAVIDPSTGALVRLVVRDRDDKLREVPAYLLATTSPTAVRLTVTYAELEEELKRHRLYSPRRYRRLSIPRRRPADHAPLLQTTADTLRVEVEGAPRL